MTRLRTEAGLTLSIALVALVAVAASGAALYATTERTVRVNATSRDRVAARYAAEAGIERARWALGRDASYTGETMRFGAHDVTVKVTAAPQGRWAVHALAASPTMRASIDATLRPTSSLPVVETWRDE